MTNDRNKLKSVQEIISITINCELFIFVTPFHSWSLTETCLIIDKWLKFSVQKSPHLGTVSLLLMFKTCYNNESHTYFSFCGLPFISEQQHECL